MKKKIKAFLSLILGIIFLFLVYAILVNSVLSNTFLNRNYYRTIIFNSDMVMEFREIAINHITTDIVNEYEGDLSKEVAEQLIVESLRNTFSLRWFQNAFLYFSNDWISYVRGDEGGFRTAIGTEDEKSQYRLNLSRNINQRLSELGHEEILRHTDELEAATDLPNQLVFGELLVEYVPLDARRMIDNIPNYRDIMILGFYFGIGIFMFLYYMLSGLIGVFRWLGGVATFGTLSFLIFIYGFSKEIIIQELLVLRLSEKTLHYIVDEFLYHAFFELIIALVLSGGILVFGIIAGREALQKKVKSKYKELKKEGDFNAEVYALENIDVIDLGNVVSEQDNFDPFAEKPVPKEEVLISDDDTAIVEEEELILEDDTSIAEEELILEDDILIAKDEKPVLPKKTTVEDFYKGVEEYKDES